MPISYQSVREFARTHGEVKLVAPKASVRILKSGETDVIDIVENATHFWFDAKHYTRQEFERLLAKSR